MTFIVDCLKKTIEPKAIPSLDGIRALSILMVILGHSPHDIPGYLSFLRNGGIGVSLFFVTSGFLITSLLVNEKEKTGKISLKNFYIKRVFRIFPAYYFFLLAILIAWISNLIPMTANDLVSASLYFWNYSPTTQEFIVGHTWSLAVEEHFYLLWPLIVSSLLLKKSLKVAIGIILASPLIRVATYQFIPMYKARLSILSHTRFDMLMFGCVLAYVWQDVNLRNKFTKFCNKISCTVSIIFLLFIHPRIELIFTGRYLMTIGYTLVGIAISIIVFHFITHYKSIAGTFLNSAPMRHLGILSYGIYLWQQPFFNRHLQFFGFWQSLLIVILCAEISFQLVELPMMRMRKRFLVDHA